jgi:uncharacterized protein YeaO (DUF488 family)
MKPDIRVKRIYDDPSAEDGYRILVDRLWPRGVSKEKARIDLWPKELTPSNDLRKWFHVDPTRHAEFVVRYTSELDARGQEVKELIESIEQPVITLVTATKDLEKGHVAVLIAFINAQSH